MAVSFYLSLAIHTISKYYTKIHRTLVKLQIAKQSFYMEKGKNRSETVYVNITKFLFTNIYSGIFCHWKIELTFKIFLAWNQISNHYSFTRFKCHVFL